MGYFWLLLLIDILKDSLIYGSLSTFKKIKLDNYTPETNLLLYGTWVNFNSNKKRINLYSEKGRFYFGDTIVFRKNNKFKRIIKDYSNYHQDTISKNNQNYNANNLSLQKQEILFDIGLNTKYIAFEKPMDQVLEIELLRKDTLIIKNHTIGKNILMKYTRVDD